MSCSLQDSGGAAISLKYFMEGIMGFGVFVLIDCVSTVSGFLHLLVTRKTKPKVVDEQNKIRRLIL